MFRFRSPITCSCSFVHFTAMLFHLLCKSIPQLFICEILQPSEFISRNLRVKAAHCTVRAVGTGVLFPQHIRGNLGISVQDRLPDMGNLRLHIMVQHIKLLSCGNRGILPEASVLIKGHPEETPENCPSSPPDPGQPVQDRSFSALLEPSAELIPHPRQFFPVP